MKFASAQLIVFLLFSTLLSAQKTAKLTLLEGSVSVIRGATLYTAAEGSELRQGDMLETSAGAVVQMEFPGNAIIVLGPATKVFIARTSSGTANSGETNFVLLTGWLKGETTSTAGAFRYSNTSLTLTSRTSSLIFHVDADGCDVNMEAGSATVHEIASKQTNTLAAGQFLSKRTGQSLTTFPRPSAVFVSAMPRAFQDALPSRLAHFQGKSPVALKADRTVSFADLQPWLALPLAWREQFVARFEPRLKDPEFRRQIDAHLVQYPEWDRAVHPEKYQENPPATNTSNPPKR